MILVSETINSWFANDLLTDNKDAESLYTSQGQYLYMTLFNKIFYEELWV